MSSDDKSTRSSGQHRPPKRTRLKDLAEALDLSPATISVVLNRTDAARAIPTTTQQRIFEMARKLDYRPNLTARSLRNQRSQSVGVLVPEISEGYAAGVVGGVEAYLVSRGYFTLVASHGSDAARLERCLEMLQARQLDGMVMVNTPLDIAPSLPAAAVGGHHGLEGVIDVAIDHRHAAHEAIRHLVDLGHQRIAVFKGHPGSADTEDRWECILEAAREHSVQIRPELTIQLSGEGAGRVFTPEEGYAEGYEFGRALLGRGVEFTALFAFNDVSAIGAMRAFFDAGRPVPEQVSVVGFDDIQSAAFQNPTLTTIRQPLRRMGELASEALIRRLDGDETVPDQITVEPKLIIRDSTGPARGAGSRPAGARRADGATTEPD